MIKEYCKDDCFKQSSLRKALGLVEKRNQVISFIGAGGKTTTMKRLAQEYNDQKIPVIVTTTTHLKIEDYPWFLLEASEEKAMEILSKYGKVWIGEVTKEGKMQRPKEEFLNQMMEKGYPVLIEADGSRRLPIKAPAEHEPVYHKKTTHVVNLYGMDCIGKTLEEVCFRAERAADILKKSMRDIIEPGDIAKLMLHERGGKKDLPEQVTYSVILNKTDTKELERQALKICKQVKENRVDNIIITGIES